MAADRFRPDAAILRLLPRLVCFQCEGDPDPCDQCADLMLSIEDEVPREAVLEEARSDDLALADKIEAELNGTRRSC